MHGTKQIAIVTKNTTIYTAPPEVAIRKQHCEKLCVSPADQNVKYQGKWALTSTKHWRRWLQILKGITRSMWKQLPTRKNSVFIEQSSQVTHGFYCACQYISFIKFKHRCVEFTTIYYDLLQLLQLDLHKNTRHTVGLFSGLLLWTGKLLHELQLVYQIYANDSNSIFLQES